MKNRFVEIALLLAVFCLLAAAVPYASQAAPSGGIHEVTGILEGIEEVEVEGESGRREKVWIITLTVGDVQASSPLEPNCRFYINDEEQQRDEFLRQALGMEVTVEFHGGGNKVSLCRAIILFLN